MTNEEEVFSFILEDVLSFERGQEVGEMISVFLDPEITVQPFNGDVSIRGIIELQGEYDLLKESKESTEDVWNEETFEVRNFVDKVVDISEERRIFSHQFPVEITIPSYRVTNMDDISMEIENFDYELLASDQIKMQSSILIHGIHQERDLEVLEDVDNDLEPLFTIEHHEDEQQATEETMPPKPVVDEREEEHLDSAQGKEDDREDNIEPLDPVEEGKQLHISARSKEDSEEEHVEHEEEDSLEETTQDRNIDYLKSMFGGEEENGQTKVRLCIVQDRDTVDSIAKRYDVKKSQLLKTNQLEDEDLVEGQLLHIPSK